MTCFFALYYKVCCIQHRSPGRLFARGVVTRGHFRRSGCGLRRRLCGSGGAEGRPRREPSAFAAAPRLPAGLVEHVGHPLHHIERIHSALDPGAVPRDDLDDPSGAVDKETTTTALPPDEPVSIFLGQDPRYGTCPLPGSEVWYPEFGQKPQFGTSTPKKHQVRNSYVQVFRYQTSQFDQGRVPNCQTWHHSMPNSASWPQKGRHQVPNFRS